MGGTHKRAIDPTPLWITFLFVVLTLAMTWPLALGLARDVPGDLGDSLLNMWILGWGVENVPWVLTGQMRLGDFWDANIFHPEPLALSLSEHLFGQVIQILPVYYLTGNLILSYNLLFLSSFVLSGLGMYLLARDMLGEGPAAFIAGLIYAFVPLRIAQVAHIQSLSSQWMPLALYGFRRFVFEGGPGFRAPTRAPASPGQLGHHRLRLLPLAGGTAALLMQNWSCGYYLVFFTPFIVLFVLHQVFTSGRTRDWRVWALLIGAAAIVAAGTWPFLSLYLEGRRVHGFERTTSEVITYSADVYSYFTASDALRVWGQAVQAYPKAEGELFFGFVPWLLALAAVTGLVGLKPSPTTVPAVVGPGFGLTTKILAAIIVIQLAGFIGILFTGGFITSFAGIPIRATNPSRILLGVAIAVGLVLAISRQARQHARRAWQSPLTLALALTVLALWLSLGPLPQSRGRVLPALGLYGLLYDYVPGFDGLRAPARYAMIAAVFLAVAAGYGAAALARRLGRPTLTAVVIGGAFVIEAAFAPMPINYTWGEGEIQPPPRVEPQSSAPAVYRQLASMSEAKIVTEFPFGDPAWELRYVYYSTVHWKRLVNGYSGAFPQSYRVRVARLQQAAENPDAAWQALRDTGTTHVIVHEAAYPSGGAEFVKQWLIAHGAIEHGRFRTDVLFELPQ